MKRKISSDKVCVDGEAASRHYVKRGRCYSKGTSRAKVIYLVLCCLDHCDAYDIIWTGNRESECT